MQLLVDPMHAEMANVVAKPDHPGKAAQQAALGEADKLLASGEVSECAVALRSIRYEMLSGAMRDRYNYLTLATAIFGAETQKEAMDILRSPQIFSAPALGYRFALKVGDMRRAKEIRRANPRLHAEFGWSASLKNLWNGKVARGLKLYPHRHQAVNFGSFVPDGAIYQALAGSPGADDAMFIEQGVGDALLHLALMASVRQSPPCLIVGPRQLEGFVNRYFPASDFRRNDRSYEDLKGRVMHASGDYLAIAYEKTGSFRPQGFIDGPVRAPFARFGVCWRGGSAQNRREQRRFDLEHFLDLLPCGHSYVALQPDIREEEHRRLQQSGRIQTPDFDIRRDIDGLFTLISTLAGVISVDSANLHLAGLANVPIYALMNTKTHWYWGRDGEVGNVYPKAKTVPRHEASRADLQNWIRQRKADFRTGLPAPVLQRNHERPVFITGIPRSGTSVITNCLQRAGLWMGATIPANRDNPRGFFENREMRETILKPNLRRVGADPLGVRRLPSLDRLAPDPTLRNRIFEIISRQGYDGRSRWGYKEPKLSLCWPIWAEAFPDATWVIVGRDTEAVVKSCLNTGFMNQHSRDAEFWRTFASRYLERLQILADIAPNVVRVSSDQIVGGDCTGLKDLVGQLDLTWSSACEDLIDPALFNRARRA